MGSKINWIIIAIVFSSFFSSEATARYGRPAMYFDSTKTSNPSKPSRLSSSTDTSTLKGLAEVGFAGTIHFYGKADATKPLGFPLGFHSVFYVKGHRFLQPILNYQPGIFGNDRPGYLQAGLKYGFISSPPITHLFLSFGYAYQCTWRNTIQEVYSNGEYHLNKIRKSYNGYVIPIEFGLKKEINNRRNAVSYSLIWEVANDNDNTLYGYGFVVSYSGIKNVFKK